MKWHRLEPAASFYKLKFIEIKRGTTYYYNILSFGLKDIVGLLLITIAASPPANTILLLLTENEIDGEAFLLLSNKDMKDLEKAVGPCAKLLKKRCQLMEQTINMIDGADDFSEGRVHV